MSDSPQPAPPISRPAPAPEPPVCDICGFAALRELKCKVICTNCRTILKSCADLV